MKKKTFQVATDIAEICVFDVACLKHRLSDAADWHTIKSEALKEINDGNLALIDLGADGYYTLQINVNVKGVIPKGEHVIFTLRCPSGKFYIGQGEMVSANDLEPDLSLGDNLGGVFIDVDTGNYQVIVSRSKDNAIKIGLSMSNKDAVNHFSDTPRL